MVYCKLIEMKNKIIESLLLTQFNGPRDQREVSLEYLSLYYNH